MRLIVSPQEAGWRLDAALAAALPEYSRAKLQKAIKAGQCKCGEIVCSNPAQKVRAGDIIELDLKEADVGLAPSQGELEILWQDEHLAVCVKPAGLTVHPCPSCQEETLVNRLLAKFPQLASQGGERPGIVHRLDKDTSGLMLIALTEDARLRLAEAFARRNIHKEYLALVAGVAPERGECHEALGRHPALKTRMAIVAAKHGGRAADTSWSRLWSEPEGKISLLKVAIGTGRTHQIRVHLSHLGWPILGDAVYAPKAVAAMAPRQMLHAWRLKFTHPFTGEAMEFSAPLPNDFYDAIMANSKKFKRIVVTGNQGCGKSSFCRALAKLCLPVISADEIVRQLYAGKSEATEWISSHFGPEAIARDGAVNKPALMRIMAEKPAMRKELEAVIHGLVLAEIESFWQKQEDLGASLAIAEIPLYFESGFAQKINPAPYVVGVSCPQERRWLRIAKNRGWSQEKIATMESWQWPEARKMAACDQVVANDGKPTALGPKARELKESLQAQLEAETGLNLDAVKAAAGD